MDGDPITDFDTGHMLAYLGDCAGDLVARCQRCRRDLPGARPIVGVRMTDTGRCHFNSDVVWADLPFVHIGLGEWLSYFNESDRFHEIKSRWGRECA